MSFILLNNITLLIRNKLGLINQFLEMEDTELNANTKIFQIQVVVMDDG